MITKISNKLRLREFIVFLGYKVKENTEIMSPRTNTADIIAFLVYVIFSGINLFISNPSIITLIINIVTALRLVLKNTLEQDRLTKRSTNPGDPDEKAIVLSYTVMIATETTATIVIMIFLIVGYFILNDVFSPFFKIIGVCWLIMNFCDQAIMIIARMYDAEPAIYKRK